MNPKPNPSEPTTESPVRYTSAAFIVIITLIVTILMTACSTTSLEESNVASADANDLVVSISPGDSYTFPGTRADDAELHTGHTLRYIATLYKSTDNTSKTISKANTVQRIEQLATEGNQVIFKGVVPGYYFIIIFADYIDASATRNSEGNFDDKYYDTHTNPEWVTLKNNIEFNNHNLDCFLEYSRPVFEKEANIGLEFNYTLKRVVSQIQVVSNGNGSMSALNKIHIEKATAFKHLWYVDGTGFKQGDIQEDRNINIDRVKSASDPNLLFFFYTFNQPSDALADIQFTLQPNEGYKFSNDGKYTITGDNDITPEANYIYKITGSFLSTTESPAKTVDLKVSVNKDWGGYAYQQVPGTSSDN